MNPLRVVRDGAPCDEDHAERDSAVGWFMDSADGTLNGNGKQDGDKAGGFEADQILTMQVDTDAGTLKFRLDGKH